MSCATLTSVSKSCDNNAGGIKQVWLWQMDDKVAVSSSFNTSSWAWDSYDVGAGANIASYEFVRNASSYTEETAIDLVNGSSFVTTTLTLIITRREASKSKAIKVMGAGQQYLGGLVLDSNGIYWLFEELQLSNVGDGSGTTKADGSKYNVQLLGEVPDFAGVIDAADAATFLSTGKFV